MELAALIEERQLVLDTVWCPRDTNSEADALTNGEFSQFDPQLRVSTDLESMGWLVIPAFMEAAPALFEATRQTRAEVRAVKRRPQKFRAPLREREPW